MNKTANTKTRALITNIILGLMLIFDLVMMFGSPNGSRNSIWGTAQLWTEKSDTVAVVCVLFIIVFIVNVAAVAVGGILTAKKGKNYMWPVAVAALSHILLLGASSAFEVLKSSALLIVALVLALGAFSINFIFGILDSRSAGETVDAKAKKQLTVIGCLSVFVSLALFYIPLCSYTVKRTDYTLFPMGVFSPNEDSAINLALFLVVVAAAAINAVLLSGCFKKSSAELSAFAAKVRTVVNFNLAVTGAYFVAGVALCSLRSSQEEYYSTVSYIPFFAMAAVALFNAFVTRNIISTESVTSEKAFNRSKLELFILGLAMSAVTIIATLSNILTISFVEPSTVEDIVINGYDVLMTYNSLEAGMQLVAFIIIAVLTVIVALTITSAVAFISKSRFFYKMTLALIIAGAVCSLLLGLLGKYYEVVQHLNKEVMTSLIETAGSPAYVQLDFRVASSSFIWFIVAMAIVAVTLIRKPYSKCVVADAPISVSSSVVKTAVGVQEAVASGGQTAPSTVTGTAATAVSASSAEVTSLPESVSVDPCPAFTELDGKIPMFTQATAARKELLYLSPNLPDLVQFVVNYARDCRLHLSYTPEDIATFIAGLGATRLTILQGMSGTGKTSLPKIFSEAVLGNCDIIEVESSWRDKNELLGYYNEFSKTYTPKKFTQALYKARLNPETVTFIVLDEMNLSRIEYYFSDFLSLMENEEDKREIKLLNISLCRTENGKSIPYYGLFEGHTIKMPKNVWFIGTANRDESTFEISDKVYDRAHTMNFNKRAVKPLTYGEPIPQRYLTVDAFVAILENAKASVKFNIDRYPLIKEVEALLEPYNISFGNRIANQIETFVSIYCACFNDPTSVLKDAVEKILLSKVVSKLEFKSVENKAQLAARFEKLGLKRCSEFVLKLNED